MCSVAQPSSPTRLAAGMGQSSKTSSAVGEARTPSLSRSFWPNEKPAMPRSTMNMLSALRGAPLTRA